MRSELARAYDFLARGDMGGTRVDESPVGRAVYTDTLPRRLDGNYLWVDRAAVPEQLVAEATRLERRLIFVPDPELGDALAGVSQVGLRDLPHEREIGLALGLAQLRHHDVALDSPALLPEPRRERVAELRVGNEDQAPQIGRASCRERV